ncbi:Oidioi.mRNA.OKI2018_I69.chr2.g8238.t1.cds [Oikopleura dioica]|uniref:Dihydrolipoamide acetyltransferase component of pyruvate dehydrogenase complex n=1 Tax=Oikopleura dioica TaxID=34765 RepID=A0ABN7T8M4_OIKDI|nr:Oidioi.mRNA.OKI2018_I69.chr2.g8238.t1.cds [Oikopleura dioica]
MLSRFARLRKVARVLSVASPRVNQQVLLRRSLATTSSAPKVIQFALSDIGEGTKEVVVKEWYVKVGQVVEEFDELVEVQSDKANVDITSRYAGKIVKIHYEIDDVAQVGDPLVDIEIEGDDDDEPVDNYVDHTESAATDDAVVTKSEEKSHKAGDKVKASPAVRKFAKDNQVDLSLVTPTGKGGTITRDDVEAFMAGPAPVAAPVPPAVQVAQGSAPPAPKPIKQMPVRAQAATSGGSRTEPLGPIAKAMQKSMTEALKIPHFGYNEEYDVTNLVELRKILKPLAAEYGIKLSYMPFIIKAVSLALSESPILNSSLSPDGTQIIYHEDHNIGFATDTPHGLLVPNIKQVQNLSILEVAQELNRLHQAGLENKLKPADIQGGTFSLSNIGAIGGTYAKPVILVPQVAIGAIGKIQRLPRFGPNDEVVARHLTYISWTADHRIIEGAQMARFSNKLKQYLEEPGSMMLHLR